jgi:hypothetical protein
MLGFQLRGPERSEGHISRKPELGGVIGIVRPIVILSKFQRSHTIGKDPTKRLQSFQ